MSSELKETRREPRFTVDVEAVVHTVAGHPLSARTRDLSKSGICLIMPAALPRGERLIIELALAFSENAFSEPLHLDARVVWCTSIADAFQIGAMFVDLSDEHSDFLEMFLRYLHGGGQGDEDDGEQSPDVKDDPFRR
jgi:hypothetical protein